MNCSKLITIALCLLGLATHNALAKTWNKDKSIEGTITIKGKLTIAPGIKVTFAKGGKLLLVHGASLVAEGTADKPIRFEGKQSGIITGYGAALSMKHCILQGLGEKEVNRGRSIELSSSAGKKLSIQSSRIKNCGQLYLKPNSGEVEVVNSAFKQEGNGASPSILTYGKGPVQIRNNTFIRASVTLLDDAEGVIQGNIIIRGSIGGWRTKSLLIVGNYVHQPEAKGSYCIPGAQGVIKDNVLRGGSWTMAKITGKVIGNVLIALPHEGHTGPGAFDDYCTHEHICGMGPDSVVRRNIFLGASYGGVMGLGKRVCTRLEFSNNTLDMKNAGRCVMLNHLPEGATEKIRIRNNIFMRCQGVQDESRKKNAADCIDHNLWSSAPTNGPRYDRITMNGLKLGMVGFGKNDLPKSGSYPPKKVVRNPEVTFPFSDKDMLSRKHSVASILKHYRKAYAPASGSPAINAGDKRIADEAVTDGKPDIGAIEYAP